MFLHLGQDTIVNTKDIVGIFDMDTSTVGKPTRDFLNKAQKEGRVVNFSFELAFQPELWQYYYLMI